MEACFDDEVERLVERLGEAVHARGCTVATAESLTGGQLASAIAAAPNADDWFHGGIVAYRAEVKHSLLDAPPGPVVTGPTAEAMASSAARLLGADCAVAVTGVGGPGPQEGCEPGTVYLATCAGEAGAIVERHTFDGEPIEVLRQTVKAALTALRERVASLPDREPNPSA